MVHTKFGENLDPFSSSFNTRKQILSKKAQKLMINGMQHRNGERAGVENLGEHPGG